MLSYILKVTLCWAAFYLIYHLLLRRETFFRLNRWYLLGTALLSLVLPYLHLQFFAEAPAAAPVVIYLQPITIGVEQLETVIISASNEAAVFDYWQLLGWVYLAGVALALCRFGYGLFKIFKLYRAGEKEVHGSYRYIATPMSHVPFSFFKNLFWSKEFQVSEEDRQNILRHEEAHIFQRHSVDVILLELLGIVFWCSPLIYLYKKAVKTTHEYLADDEVLRNASRKRYGRLLLRQFQPTPQIAISNSLFSSQLKERIVMMTKTKSSKSAAAKYLAALPILVLLVLVFSSGKIPEMQAIMEKMDDLPGEQPQLTFERGTTEPPFRLSGNNIATQTTTTSDTLPTGEGDVFKVVEEMPRFPGCEDVDGIEERKLCSQKKMLEFVLDNLKYPAEAREKNIEGMVVVSFIVEKDGSIADAEIVRGIGGGCDEEVLRLAYLMPNWIPGKQRGQNVRVQFNLPVRFKLDSKAVSEKEKEEVDEMPRFLAGCENLVGEEQSKCSNVELINFIVENLKYPKGAKENGVEGMVVAKFTIAADGSLQDPKVVKSLEPSCDTEVLRVLALMPNWQPGEKDGQPVAVEMKLPFKFALPKADGTPSAKTKAKPSSAVEFFEVYPNPSNENGFTYRFKTEAGPIKFVVTDILGKQLASVPFDSYDGTEQTVRFDGLFEKNAVRGNVIATLLDADGNVLDNVKVVIQ